MHSLIEEQYNRIVGLKSDMVDKIVSMGGTSSTTHTFAQIAQDLETIINPTASIIYDTPEDPSSYTSIADSILLLKSNRQKIAQSIIDLGGQSDLTHTFLQLVSDIETLHKTVSPTYMTITPKDFSLLEGSSIDLTPVFFPIGSSSALTWTCDATQYISIVPNTEGSATVTAIATPPSTAGPISIIATSTTDPSLSVTCTCLVGSDFAARIGKTTYQYLAQNTSSAAFKVTAGQTITVLKDNNEQYADWGGPYFYVKDSILDLGGNTLQRPTIFFGHTGTGTMTIGNGTVLGSIDPVTHNGGTGDIFANNLDVVESVYTGTRNWNINNCQIENEMVVYGNNSAGRVAEIYGDTTRISSFRATLSEPMLIVNVHNGYYKTDLSEHSFISVIGGTMTHLDTTPYPGYSYQVVPHIAWIAAAYSDLTSRTQFVNARQKDTNAYLNCSSESNKRIHYGRYSTRDKLMLEVSTTARTTYQFVVPDVTLPVGATVTFNISQLRGQDGYAYGTAHETSITCNNASEQSLDFTMPSRETDYSMTFTLDTALNNEDLVITLSKKQGSRDPEGAYHYIIFSCADIKF